MWIFSNHCTGLPRSKSQLPFGTPPVSETEQESLAGAHNPGLLRLMLWESRHLVRPRKFRLLQVFPAEHRRDDIYAMYLLSSRHSPGLARVSHEGGAAG